VKNTYRKLLDEIAGIYDSALKDVHLAVEAILKTAYWKIGERVVETEQDGSIRARYGAHLLEHISDDMTKTNRKGFSVRNLRNMRQVYATFPIRQLTAELTWTHYVVLSVIKDKEEREAYLEKAVGEKWSVPQLRDVLVRDQVKTIPPDNGDAKRLPDSPAKGEVPRLAFKRGIINAYRVLEPRASDEKNNRKIRLDCGFGVIRAFRLLSPTSVKPGGVVALAESASGAAQVKEMTSKDLKVDPLLYTYAAEVIRVIDGDTLKVEAKVAETSWVKKKLRLRRINCPEIDTPEGKKARDFVVKKLKDCPWIVVKTYSTDIHDRYLVDVFYLSGCDDPVKIALEGKLLNQELLDAGLAELWRTPDLLELAMLN
jgi:endonuclease YncB( thermonuclease family)